MADVKTYSVEVKQQDSAALQQVLKHFGLDGAKAYKVVAVGVDKATGAPVGGEVGLLVAPCYPDLDG